MSLSCTVERLQMGEWVTIINGVKLEFNDMKSLYTKNDFERRRSVNL